MAKILEQLYCGELFPYERYKPTIEALKRKQKKSLDSYTDLIAKLPPDQQEQFTDIIDAQFNLVPLEMEQNFIDGFRLGARMMAEIFYNESESQA